MNGVPKGRGRGINKFARDGGQDNLSLLFLVIWDKE